MLKGRHELSGMLRVWVELGVVGYQIPSFIIYEMILWACGQIYGIDIMILIIAWIWVKCFSFDSDQSLSLLTLIIFVIWEFGLMNMVSYGYRRVVGTWLPKYIYICYV